MTSMTCFDAASLLWLNQFMDCSSGSYEFPLTSQNKSYTHRMAYLFRFEHISMKTNLARFFMVSDPNLPAKFGARQPLNGGVVSGRTRPQTLLKL